MIEMANDIDTPDDAPSILVGAEFLGLEKLLNIALEDTNMLRTDLVDIERAYLGAAQELEKLCLEDKAVRGVADADHERFRALQITVLMLGSAEEAARHRLFCAGAKIQKLERLMKLTATNSLRCSEFT